MKFSFSDKSIARRSGVDVRLIEVSNLAIEITAVDFGIPAFGGRRTAELQRLLFDEGKSRADGYSKVSKHQKGKALDFYAFVNGRATWEPYPLAMVAAAMLQAAAILGHQVEWGGLWTPAGGEIRSGIAHGWDMGHIELVD